MKKAQSVGLIGTGRLTDSPLTRFWWLSERLGPVKSASYRLASRIANMLQAGHPVKDYAEFESCVLILVCVPEENISQVVSEMLSSGISWRGKAVVLCSTWLDSGALRDLSTHGASVGSISPIPGFDDQRYLVEGDTLAIRESKRLVEHRDRRVLAIERPLKPYYLAALTCTGQLAVCLTPRCVRIVASLRYPVGTFGDIAGTANHSHASFVSQGRPARLPGTARTPQAITRALRGLARAGALFRTELPRGIAADGLIE